MVFTWFESEFEIMLGYVDHEFESSVLNVFKQES